MPSQLLTEEGQLRRDLIRKALWNEVHGETTPPGLEKWTTFREDWISQDGAEACCNWLGGAYTCRFPPRPELAAILNIQIDIRNEIYPVTWGIYVTRDSPFYDGEHKGKLEFKLSAESPIEEVKIIWLSPIFSPLVKFHSGVGEVSSPFDLEKCPIQRVLQAIANHLAFDPYGRSEPRVVPLEVPYQLHRFESEIQRYTQDRHKFIRAAQFFSRVYCQLGNSQRDESITAIKELVNFFFPQDNGRAHLSLRISGQVLEGHYNVFDSLENTIEGTPGERIWADALSLACGLGFICP